MTIVAPGAQLAPVDLPPPPPHSDPREPSPATHRGRAAGSQTPRKVQSPDRSRGSSPIRPVPHRAQSSDLSPGSSPGPLTTTLPLHAPTPRSLRSSVSGPSIGPSASSGTSNPLGVGGAGYHPPHHSRPSSPAASIHSSTSAIFERDIEFPAVASLSINPNQPTSHTLSHKASRLSHLSHGSPLDHTVPAVLDDAVEALTSSVPGTSRGIEGLEIEAPAPSAGGIGMARQSSASFSSAHGATHSHANRKVSVGPSGLATSRSSSPMSAVSAGSSIASPIAQSPPIHGQLSGSALSTGGPGEAASPPGGVTGFLQREGGGGSHPTRPEMPERLSTGPILPGGWGFGQTSQPLLPTTEPSVEGNSAVQAQPELEANTSDVPAAELQDEAGPLGTSSLTPIPSHLTPSKDKRRISFVSYNDILLSVPTTVTHLTEITSGNLSPDHLPGTVSPNLSMSSGMARSPVVPPPNPFTGAAGASSGSETWEAGTVGSGGVRGLGVGEGEWEREGLGKGLEQRLEDLVSAHPKA